MEKHKKYKGKIPPCGIFCGSCPKYLKENDPCKGADVECLERKCKTIYECCVDKRGYKHCHECKNFPCSKFKKFAERWEKLGQYLIKNQKKIKKKGEEEFLKKMNKKSKKKKINNCRDAMHCVFAGLPLIFLS